MELIIKTLAELSKKDQIEVFEAWIEGVELYYYHPQLKQWFMSSMSVSLSMDVIYSLTNNGEG